MPERVLTISQLTRRIRTLLEGSIGEVWVGGEVSNLRRQASGHQYFTLKDEGAQLSCVLFRGNARRIDVDLADGLQVEAFGQLSVYEPQGKYQFIVRQLRLHGLGALQARFEALKQRLNQEGLFDPARKQPIPPNPAVIALVTSPTGAAVRDMLNVLERRAPWIRVLIAPVPVQGRDAAPRIAAAIDHLNRHSGDRLPVIDTIIAGRGGGSLEDLWPFNEEIVARAIAGSKLPVISAVGHEIDFTIADFAADLRAPTPSAAAELAVPDGIELRRRLAQGANRLRQPLLRHLAEVQGFLERSAAPTLQREPARRFITVEQTTDLARERLHRALALALQQRGQQVETRRHQLERAHPSNRLRERAQRFEHALARLRRALRHRWQSLEQQLDARHAQLRTLGPDATLARGFTLTYQADGRLLTGPEQARPGDRLKTRLAAGWIDSEVVEAADPDQPPR